MVLPFSISFETVNSLRLGITLYHSSDTFRQQMLAPVRKKGVYWKDMLGIFLVYWKVGTLGMGKYFQGQNSKSHIRFGLKREPCGRAPVYTFTVASLMPATQLYQSHYHMLFLCLDFAASITNIASARSGDESESDMVALIARAQVIRLFSSCRNDWECECLTFSVPVWSEVFVLLSS